MFKEDDPSNRQKIDGCFLRLVYQAYGKKSVGFCLNTGKRFFLVVLT